MTCLRLGTLLGHKGKQIVATAAIFHDFGKIHECWLEDTGAGDQIVTNRPWKKMIGHLPFSFLEFVKRAEEADMNSNFIYQVSHCILAHHGRREWGSPVEPQTPEAHILHSADMLSMQRQGGEDKK